MRVRAQSGAGDASEFSLALLTIQLSLSYFLPAASHCAPEKLVFLEEGNQAVSQTHRGQLDMD